MKKCERCNYKNSDVWLKLNKYCEHCGKNLLENLKIKTNIKFYFNPPDDTTLNPLDLKIEDIHNKKEIKLTIFNKNADSSTKLF